MFNFKNLKLSQKAYVINVISFRDSISNHNGRIVYRRPLSSTCNRTQNDDFDNSMLTWLKQLNFINVQFCHSEVIYHKKQLQQIRQIYILRKQKTILKLRWHGDYTSEEMKKMGGFKMREMKFPIYWNAIPSNQLPLTLEVVTFDKNKEQYYLNTGIIPL